MKRTEDNETRNNVNDGILLERKIIRKMVLSVISDTNTKENE